MNKNQPLYLVPPTDPMIKSWEPKFLQLEKGNLDLIFTVNPNIVNGNEVAYIQQMVIALQHYPHLIEKMLFAVSLRFRLVDDVEVELSEDAWKTDPQVYRWFHAMHQLPLIVFFIKDHDARFYTLFGDYLSAGGLDYEMDANGNAVGIRLNEEQIQTFAQRIYASCKTFWLYCYGTGFNCDTYIDALIADYDMPFSVAEISKECEDEIEKGAAVRVVPIDNK
ncbi:MAG TPA: hypothetical protein VL095_16960 [Flavisolibacter sp.]|nr:hypothetical protein [Flavisolibacter sp.]